MKLYVILNASPFIPCPFLRPEQLLKGAYSCLCLVNGVGMVAFRDPFGIRCVGVVELKSPGLVTCLFNPLLPLPRPLVIGKREGPNGEDEWCIASEDCAFGPIGFTR